MADDTKRCYWCNTDAVEAAKRHEGPHATYCPRYKTPPIPKLPASVWNGLQISTHDLSELIQDMELSTLHPDQRVFAAARERLVDAMLRHRRQLLRCLQFVEEARKRDAPPCKHCAHTRLEHSPADLVAPCKVRGCNCTGYEASDKCLE